MYTCGNVHNCEWPLRSDVHRLFLSNHVFWRGVAVGATFDEHSTTELHPTPPLCQTPYTF